ncbi:MAG: hypothetical protein SF066_09405 [Thermoanaerobaculia bacterium]|nr:hypothetical protein [Thermoanaerobaculia bacterium]
MRVLFDQGTPVPLRRFLSGHRVSTAFELGWMRLKNGDLLKAAEESGFEVFVTTDSNLKYQQNLGARVLAIVVLNSASWPRIALQVEQVVRAVDEARPGSYAEVLV